MIKLSKMHKRLLALSAVMPMGAAVAQTAPAAADVPQLETITVTAQRRTENIKDVPVSVSTLKDEKLDVLVSGGQDIRLLALTAVMPIGSAFADTAAAPATEPQLETVTVTAQRRTENIKDVPVSVSMLKAENLDVLLSGGQDIRFLAGKTPSLNVESSNGRTFPRFYIRGYGNTDFSTFASQPVSLVYDDVVQENGILKGFPIFDVANVEVLRGPQGTLFGRNTPAGVVKFESEKPNTKGIEGYYNLSLATHNTANVEAAANIPLSKEWAMRVSTLR